MCVVLSSNFLSFSSSLVSSLLFKLCWCLLPVWGDGDQDGSCMIWSSTSLGGLWRCEDCLRSSSSTSIVGDDWEDCCIQEPCQWLYGDCGRSSEASMMGGGGGEREVFEPYGCDDVEDFVIPPLRLNCPWLTSLLFRKCEFEKIKTYELKTGSSSACRQHFGSSHTKGHLSNHLVRVELWK